VLALTAAQESNGANRTASGNPQRTKSPKRPAESAAASPLQTALNVLNAPTQALLGRPLVGNGANGAPGIGAAGGAGGIFVR
jgi:hypothetical protein